jgi:RNA recognition motif-containing protein
LIGSIYDSVGEVSFVELFEDESGKPRGCGIIEFERLEHARLALEKMHRYELKGRKLVVKEVRTFISFHFHHLLALRH